MVLEADLRRSLYWETVQPEKRQFVPVAPLKGNPAVSDGEEAAASQAQGIAPFEDCDIAGFVDDFGNASHFSSGKVSLEHLANCRAALNGFACHLMVHSVFVIEFRNGSSVAFVETSDELFNDFAGAHQAVLFRSLGQMSDIARNSWTPEPAGRFPKWVNWRLAQLPLGNALERVGCT
jgi:hypothetical protein